VTETPQTIVVCLKWGTAYPAHYVNVLHRAVAAHLTAPHRFVCLTDVAEGLVPGVEAVDIPLFPLPREKWANGIWPKLTLFTPGLFPPGAVVLYLDVDIMVTGALDPLIERVRSQRGLHVIREWNPSLVRLLPLAWRPDRGANSSVVGFITGAQDHILAQFSADPAAALAAQRNDQEFINAHAADKHYWPEPWCVSFKRACVWYWPLNLMMRTIRQPRNARVIVFHGRPNPTDLLCAPGVRWGARRKFGWGPVPWVADYWRRFGG